MTGVSSFHTDHSIGSFTFVLGCTLHSHKPIHQIPQYVQYLGYPLPQTYPYVLPGIVSSEPTLLHRSLKTVLDLNLLHVYSRMPPSLLSVQYRDISVGYDLCVIPVISFIPGKAPGSTLNLLMKGSPLNDFHYPCWRDRQFIGTCVGGTWRCMLPGSTTFYYSGPNE